MTSKVVVVNGRSDECVRVSEVSSVPKCVGVDVTSIHPVADVVWRPWGMRRVLGMLCVCGSCGWRSDWRRFGKLRSLVCYPLVSCEASSLTWGEGLSVFVCPVSC